MTYGPIQAALYLFATMFKNYLHCNFRHGGWIMDQAVGGKALGLRAGQGLGGRS